MTEFKLNMFCRLCLAELNDKEKQTIFTIINEDSLENDLKEISINDVIVEFSSIKIEPNDKFSTFICLKCVDIIKIFYKFKTTCKLNDKKIQIYLNKKSLFHSDDVFEDIFSPFVDELENENDFQTDSKNLEIKYEYDGEVKDLKLDIKIENDLEKEYEKNNIDVKVESNNVKTKRKRKDKPNKTKEKKLKNIERVLLNRRLNQLKYEKRKLNIKKVVNVKKQDELSKLISTVNKFEFEHNCSSCRRAFFTAESLRHHLEIAHGNLNDIQCDFCGKILRQIEHHYELHVKKLRHLKQFNFDINQLKEDHVAFCILCQKHFESAKQLNDHYKNHKDLQCDACNVTFTSLEMTNKHFIDNHQLNIYICLKCFHNFSQKSTLDFHLGVHDHLNKNCKLFTCHICKSKFITQFDLILHINEHSDNMYKCYKCDNCYDNINDFRTHMKNKHTEVPLCSHCGLQFATHEKLRIHLKMLRLKIPHKCPICNKMYADRNNLSNHIRMSHNQIEKKFPCNECGKKFVTSTQLKIHLGSHSDFRPHKCPITECGKQFKRVQHLKSHMLSHTGEKNKECTICLKRFARKETLRAHVRVHLGDMPWKCDYCGKRFVFKSKYLRHVAAHDKIKNQILKE